MNTRIVATTAIACLLASALASAQYPKDAKAEGDKPSAASEMPRAAPDAMKAPAKPAGPKLNMDAPVKNPGKDRDLRNCLDLATNSEIIKCSQKR
jgi:hypothetical protein